MGRKNWGTPGSTPSLVSRAPCRPVSGRPPDRRLPSSWLHLGQWTAIDGKIRQWIAIACMEATQVVLLGSDPLARHVLPVLRLDDGPPARAWLSRGLKLIFLNKATFCYNDSSPGIALHPPKTHRHVFCLPRSAPSILDVSRGLSSSLSNHLYLPEHRHLCP